MRKVLIDTNIYSNALKGEESAVEIIRTYDKILISPVVVGELYSGFRKGSREKENRLILKRFLVKERVELIHISDVTSEYYSFILDQLRKQGTPIPTNDIWIAASAMEHGAFLATGDKHYDNISGLILV